MAKRNWVFLAIGVIGLIVAIAGDHYLTRQKPSLFPGLADSPFLLVTHEGETITQDDLIGRPTAIYFGFTWCPDICPTSLSSMADMKADIMQADSAAANDLQLVFFTVDPKRDTVAQMADYVSLFSGDILGITGDHEAIQQALLRFGIFAQQVGEGEDYLVDHSSSVYLYDSNGQFKGTISPAEPYEMGLAKMGRLTGAKGLN